MILEFVSFIRELLLLAVVVLGFNLMNQLSTKRRFDVGVRYLTIVYEWAEEVGAARSPWLRPAPEDKVATAEEKPDLDQKAREDVAAWNQKYTFAHESFGKVRAIRFEARAIWGDEKLASPENELAELQVKLKNAFQHKIFEILHPDSIHLDRSVEDIVWGVEPGTLDAFGDRIDQVVEEFEKGIRPSISPWWWFIQIRNKWSPGHKDGEG